MKKLILPPRHLSVYKEKVLLRKHAKYIIWLSIGGHIELNEDPVEAALREVMEEVGLAITFLGTPAPTEATSNNFRELLPPRFLNRNRISPTHEHITFVYFARSRTDHVIPEQPQDEWRWFTLEELDEPSFGIVDSIKFYAKAALAESKNTLL